MVLEPIKRLSIPYRFYQINPRFEIADRIDLDSDEYMIVNNYYGIKDLYIRSLYAKYGEHLIVDCAQAFFAPVVPGIKAFYSSRKFVGVADGGIAYLGHESVAKTYYEALKDVKGISFYPYLKETFDNDNLHYNYSYMPMFVNAEEYGMTRDELYAKMKEAKVLGIRYFYPLISEFSTYKGCQGADRSNLPNAHMMADSVICLPMHHSLKEGDIVRVLELICK